MRRVRFKSIKPLWETNRWDGPLAGFCAYRGTPHYFKVVEYGPGDEWRKYAIHPLSTDVFSYHESRHADFRMWVGEHCDYAKGFIRVDRPYEDKGTSGLFYEKHAKTPPECDPEVFPATHFFFYPDK